MEIYPNAYYNYRKHRRAKEVARKQDILHQIQTIYHETNGVAGYRRMRIYLARNGIELSALTVHKYMNMELGLRSIVRRKAPRYQGGTQHKKFENLLTLWNILLIPPTTMYDRILITDIVHHSKRDIRHKLIGHSCYKNA